jgi:peptidoglycan hydrolase-like protein with peptidoglycan-binding domain
MSKLTVSKPSVSTPSPVKSRPASSPVKKPTTVKTPSAKPVDTTAASAESKTNDKTSDRVKDLTAGLGSWGAEPAKTDQATKGGQEVKATEPLTLDKGQFLRKGSSGDKVTQLQELLKAKGAKIDVDGKFGPKTLAALKKFQGDSDLGADGVVGPNTLAKLNGPAAETGAKGTQVVDPAKASALGQTDQKQPLPDSAAKTETGNQAKADQPQANGKFSDTRDALDKLPEPLKKYADTFQAAGEKYGVDPRFLAAISMHETGNGKSSAFRNKNNAMGISGRKGPLHISSVEASIERMAQGLSKPDGYYKGKDTIGQIGKVYAPDGAANDPSGLNAHWAKGVAKNFKSFGGDPTQSVIFRSQDGIS